MKKEVRIPFTEHQVREALDEDMLARAFKTRLELLQLKGSKLVEEFREETARAMLRAGVCLIPSEQLHDHQFVVSQGVYEAAQRILK